MKIRTSELQKALSALRDLPPKDPHISAAKAAQELAPVVRELRARGYSNEDIAEHLARLGVPISAYALKRVKSRNARAVKTAAPDPAPADTAARAPGGPPNRSFGDRAP